VFYLTYIWAEMPYCKPGPFGLILTMKMRASGIPSIEYLRWGSHLCQFFEGPRQLLDLLVPYFKAGLETGEACVWITAPPLTNAEALTALHHVMADPDSYIESGQLEILDYKDWYLQTGTFDAQRVLKGWALKASEARRKGFEGLRVSGNPMWLETRDDWSTFAKYERTVNEGIANSRMIALCTYSLDHCSAPDVVDVIANHRATIVSTSKGWEVVHHPRFACP